MLDSEADPSGFGIHRTQVRALQNFFRALLFRHRLEQAHDLLRMILGVRGVSRRARNRGEQEVCLRRERLQSKLIGTKQNLLQFRLRVRVVFDLYHRFCHQERTLHGDVFQSQGLSFLGERL